VEEPLIYRAFADIYVGVQRIRRLLQVGKKRKRIWKSEEERLAWERHSDQAIQNLRELAAGRAQREWREKHGNPRD
jgi:hypothetical protein